MDLDAQTRELQLIDEMLEENEGELTPEIEERLTAALSGFAAQADQIVKWAREAEARAAALKEIAAKYAADSARAATRADRLTRYLLSRMQANRQKRIRTALWEISRVRIGTPRMTCPLSGGDLPQILRRIIPEKRELDKKRALELLIQDIEKLPEKVGKYEFEVCGVPIEVEIRERLQVR